MFPRPNHTKKLELFWQNLFECFEYFQSIVDLLLGKKAVERSSFDH
jgi:hypothetical protein